MSQILKFAIFGTTGIADSQRAPSVNRVEGAELWSVLSRDLKRAEEFARRHDASSPTPAHDSLESILADKSLDAVIITSPDALHAEQAIASARAGKHVFVEKPMATTKESAEAMIKAAKNAGVGLGVAYRLRFHPGHIALRNRVLAGEIGELRHIRVMFAFVDSETQNWRATGELSPWWALGRAGTHIVDFARWIMSPNCGDVSEIRSLISREQWRRNPDETALVSMRFESGATAELCTSAIFAAETSVELFGSNGAAICKGSLTPKASGTISINGSIIDYKPVNVFDAELKDFIESIRQQRNPEVGDFEGLWNVEALIQIHSG